MDEDRITAQCEFEDVSAGDILDGLRTLTGRSGKGAIISPPGTGPDDPLAWAIQEVTNAAHTPNKQEIGRLCTNAIVNSRRALACLVEWYFERDLGKFCKDAPKTAKQQADFLMRRGIIDNLTSSVLERAIAKRNAVEHNYVVPDLDTAEDVVGLIRRTMAALRNQSDPAAAPRIFGIFLCEYGHGHRGPYAEFLGWCEPLTVFSRLPPRQWIGLVLPAGKAKAVVRRAYLDNTTIEELILVLTLAEQKYGHTSSFTGLETCELLAREIGLLGAS